MGVQIVFVSVELVDDVMARGEVKVKAGAVWFLPSTCQPAVLSPLPLTTFTSLLQRHHRSLRMATNNTADAAASRSNTATPVPDPAADYSGPDALWSPTLMSPREAEELLLGPVASLSTPEVPSTTHTVPATSQVSSTPNSLFSDPAPSDMDSEPATTPSPGLKRKATDPNLKVVTIDPFYDFTLIVGSSGSFEPQTAFQVNKGTLRHASEVWTKMLTGPWNAGLKNQSEIELLDDSPWAFEIVLRIAHLQTDKLPVALTLAEMKSLAVLTDKYDLAKVMHMPIEHKDWIFDPSIFWRQWDIYSSLQDWAFVTHVFKFEDDCDYLVNRLAVEVQIDSSDDSFYYFTGDQKTKLRADLPDCLLGKSSPEVLNLTTLTRFQKKSSIFGAASYSNGFCFATPYSTPRSFRPMAHVARLVVERPGWGYSPSVCEQLDSFHFQQAHRRCA